MSIKKWIRDWLLGESGPKLRMNEVNTVEQSQEPGVQISINSAINGRVLTLRTYQPTRNNRSDWLTELYIVKDGESLTEALTMLLLMKGVDQ
jgi:hypothetical protein